MTDPVNPLAGKPVPASMLVNVAQLVTAYFSLRPDPAIASQRVAFGTSGHRGSALEASFNEAHILAIAQAVCDHRRGAGKRAEYDRSDALVSLPLPSADTIRTHGRTITAAIEGGDPELVRGTSAALLAALAAEPDEEE